MTTNGRCEMHPNFRSDGQSSKRDQKGEIESKARHATSLRSLRIVKALRNLQVQCSKIHRVTIWVKTRQLVQTFEEEAWQTWAQYIMPHVLDKTNNFIQFQPHPDRDDRAGSLVWNKSIVTIWFYIPTSSTPWLKCLELRLFWTRSVNFCLFWIRVSWSRSRVLIAEFTKTPVITLSTCTTIYLCIWYIHLPVHLSEWSESTPRFICPCFHWHTFISSSPCYLLSCTQKIH